MNKSIIDKLVDLGTEGVFTPQETILLLKLVKEHDSQSNVETATRQENSPNLYSFKDYPPYMDLAKPKD